MDLFNKVLGSRGVQPDPADLPMLLLTRPAFGWGQDGHVAYNQARRHPFSPLTLAELRGSTARVQENNLDTVIALAQRTFGGAYQFVPPMSVTLLGILMPVRLPQYWKA